MKRNPEPGWLVAAWFVFLLPVGCAHLATVETKPEKLPVTVVADQSLESARQYLAAAEHEQPMPALGHDLLAAQIAYNALIRRPNDISARNVYAFAVARTVQNVGRANLQPWRHPVDVPPRKGISFSLLPSPSIHGVIQVDTISFLRPT